MKGMKARTFFFGLCRRASYEHLASRPVHRCGTVCHQHIHLPLPWAVGDGRRRHGPGALGRRTCIHLLRPATSPAAASAASAAAAADVASITSAGHTAGAGAGRGRRWRRATKGLNDVSVSHALPR